MKKKYRLPALLTGAVLAMTALSAPAGASDIPQSVFDRLPLMYERIAGWDDTTAEDCITFVTPDDPNGIAKMITPKNYYEIGVSRISSYRVTTGDGNLPDADRIAADWKAMLLEKGYPVHIAEQQTFEATVTPEDDTCLVELTGGQPGWMGYSFLDVLKADTNIKKITAQFQFHTDSRVNPFYADGIAVRVRDEREWSAADFPELNIESFQLNETGNCYQMVLTDAEFADYFNAMKLLWPREDIEVSLYGKATLLGDASAESSLPMDGWQTVFYRGDMNGDNRLNVADAVLLAQLAGEVPDAGIPAAGFINADTDGDGLITSVDIRALLLLVIEENLQT